MRAAFDEIHGSMRRDFMIAMTVVFVVTIPFVLRYFLRNNKEMDRRMVGINRALEPYDIWGKYPGGSKQGPGRFEYAEELAAESILIGNPRPAADAALADGGTDQFVEELRGATRVRVEVLAAFR